MPTDSTPDLDPGTDVTPTAVPLPMRTDGHGPVVLLLHGVGFGAATMRSVTRHLVPSVAVLVPDRPGYGGARDRGPADLAAQLAALVATLDAADASRVVVAGISGGATLGLALALAFPERVAGWCLHEPLIGPLAGTLHRGVVARVAELDPHHAVTSAGAFLRALVGRADWERIPGSWRAGALGSADTVVAEAPAFAAFAPPADALRGLAAPASPSGPGVTTLGGASPSPRREAAEVLAQLTGARVDVLPGCGHLAQFDAPGAFARCVADAVARAEAATVREAA